MRCCATGLSCVLLFGALGCGGSDGPELGRVEGTVTLDGKPLPAAEVTFKPIKGRPAQATTNEEGHYELVYGPGKQGAMVGENKISVSTRKPPEQGETLDDGRPNPDKGVPELVPAKYNEETTLKRDVKPGSNTIDLELQSK
ncbi:hypothetical protein Pan216_48010 [Planctomycetes bacterium Pan216]|uniref:Nickel uptake substrate-specific transmembrane region n=1 Tax=Kolteria novifilia TaxID=2527975 RepID=A0A518BAA2_9BACT|nr:hypothetical protein Pan216_48010 [Planctomycetes bacterium Pan216]